MLLLHQIGSVKIGEVVRYTVTYTPSQDRILPSPEKLYLRVRNTSAIALRAAFVHGPYNLCAAAYPAGFNPNLKFPNPRRYGVPEFEPMVKAGGTWQCELVVPEHIRQSAATGGGLRDGHFGGGPDRDDESASWVIEVSSQVIFSTSAAVGYEIVLARDEKSLNLSSSLPVIGNQAQVPQPGRVSDHQREDYKEGERTGHHNPLRPHHAHHTQPKGVFSRAIRIRVEDTASLWNTPRLPGWDYSVRLSAKDKVEKVRQKKDKIIGEQASSTRPSMSGDDADDKSLGKPAKPKRVHLVVLSHGLHSNLGADLLYLKESIDATVKQAKIDAKARRAKEKESRKAKPASEKSASQSNGQDPPTEDEAHNGKGEEEADTGTEKEEEDEDEDDEEVIVRGFAGNATRTERGIKFLGKRLARYVLSTCYPDQPYLPSLKGAAESMAASARTDGEGRPTHKGSATTGHKDEGEETPRSFKVTSISFIGHSLGGLVQTYAIAYIQKHSPRFFELIKPVNFVTLATPFLGLSNENPLYVKFALDFGLVGRTGQDLGLTWRAPTIARSGWGAIVGNLGESAHKKVIGESRPESKPLLRILPTGPAHTALRKFRNRTIYSNVVNDGIVPLRTSCLLFLDWQGLGRVEKARRDAGLVETLVGAGWAELTGANVTGARRDARQLLPPEEAEAEAEAEDDGPSGAITPTAPENASEVPQPSDNVIIEDDRASLRSVPGRYSHEGSRPQSTEAPHTGPFAGFFSLFRSNEPQSPTSPGISPKQNKIYRRSQTIKSDEESATASTSSVGSKVTTGQEFEHDVEGLNAPPRTTFFESAHDLINPKLPTTEYIIDPAKRPRTIFHDRVYHPSDIPPPPLKKKASSSGPLLRRRNTSQSAKSWNTSSSTTMTNTESKDKDNAQAPLEAPNSPSPYPSQSIDREDSMLSTKDYDDTVHTNPGKAPDEEIDGSQMRVEEKIARAYHRGIAWRKVLVKVEPDAHNNIIVRRMFANAYGWPVVKHLVDAHFSDAAAVRTRVDEEKGEERALDIGQPPDQYGREIKRDANNAAAGSAASTSASASKTSVSASGKAEGKEGSDKGASYKESVAEETAKKEERKVGEQGQERSGKLDRDNNHDGNGEGQEERPEALRSHSLAREAEDQVPELPSLPQSEEGAPHSSHGIVGSNASNGSPPRPHSQSSSEAHSPSKHRPYVARCDSVTWSDGDWADTEDEESDAGTSGWRTPGRTPVSPSGGGRETSPDSFFAGHDSAGKGKDGARAGGGMLSPLTGTGRDHSSHKSARSRSTSPLPDRSQNSSSGGGTGWSWTEKIVGKGSSTGRSVSGPSAGLGTGTRDKSPPPRLTLETPKDEGGGVD